jgi:soluble lytic murein transglycosylase-like protein
MLTRPALIQYKRSHKWYFILLIVSTLALIFLPRLVASTLAEKKFEMWTLMELSTVIAQKENLNTNLIVSMIKQESQWNPNAVSNKGAIGLMQVMPEWIPKLNHLGIRSRKDLFDPEKNLLAGCWVLKVHLRENKGDLRKALEAYSGNAKEYKKKVYLAYKYETLTSLR